MKPKQAAIRYGRLLVPWGAVAFGLGIYQSAAWLVHHDNINYWLREHGLRLVSNRAEEVFGLGPVVTGVGGLLVGIAVWIGLAFFIPKNDPRA